MVATESRQSSGVERWVLISAAAIWLVSFAVLLATSPSGTPVSSDANARAIPYWITLLPVAVGIALVLLLPLHSPSRPAAIREPRRFAVTSIGLIVLAVIFPVAVASIPLEGELFILGKLLLLMIVPAVLLLAFRRGVTIHWNRDSSRWWAPAIVIIVWTTLSQVAPWNPPFEVAGFDPAFVVVAAVATALTAGVGEELFYRRWLQTRLEAKLGAWTGIIVASLAFALMHLGSHGTGDVLTDIARVIVVQGSFGLFLGIMWWRYRNLLAIIVIHIIANGWGVAAALLRI